MALTHSLNGIEIITMSRVHNYIKKSNPSKIAIVGLGYVGLPLALEFARIKDVVGFDPKLKRIENLKKGHDTNLEISKKKLKAANKLTYTANIDDLRDCNIFIITVPTPINQNNTPDLNILNKASSMIGKIIKKNDIVIYESTVYPGATEEFCVPILEKKSGLKFNLDFFCGYSPERINPGDKKHSITSIKKVTSGSNPKIANVVDKLYKRVIKAGTHKAPSIKVAEAAKIIENTQRDVNIALINELSMIFNKLKIDTKSVLDAAETKWNFLPFKPGLVGGHCIGVDPYYLAHKALKAGHNPKIILAGRKINDGMSIYVIRKIKELMKKKNISKVNARVLIMGVTFKENCPDIRNSKIIDIVKQFRKLKIKFDIHDPWADKSEIKNEHGIKLINKPMKKRYDIILLAVAHSQFKKISLKKIKSFAKKKHIIYDLKQFFKGNKVDGGL